MTFHSVSDKAAV